MKKAGAPSGEIEVRRRVGDEREAGAAATGRVAGRR